MVSRSPKRSARLAGQARTVSNGEPGKPEPASHTRRPRFAAVTSQEDASTGSGAIALSFAVVYRKRAFG
jgi:hypothetical protein